MKPTREEQETIICFDEACDTANVFTYNRRLQLKLESLAVKHPKKIIHARDSPDGARTYLVPKRCISIRAPYSEERREADRQRALEAQIRPPNREFRS